MKTTSVAITDCTNRSPSLNAVIFCVIFASIAQATLAKEAPPEGHLDFEAAKLPAATVEVDLSQDTFRSLFGISDAAIAGVAETLFKSQNEEDSESDHLVAEQVEAVRQIVKLGGAFIREVRVRAYDGFPDGTNAESLLKPFDGQLKAAKWETVVRVHSDDDMVRVAMFQKEGSIRGIFVAATDGDQLAVVNIVCDISPDKVKPMTAAVAKLGKSIDLQAIGILEISRPEIFTEAGTESAVHNLQVATKTSTPAAAPAAAKSKK